MTPTGRCAGPPTAPARRPSPSTTRTSTRPNHINTPAATGEQHRERHPVGQRPAHARLTSSAIERGQPERGRPPPPRHPSIARGSARIAWSRRVSDTRPRVISEVVSTPLAVVRLDRDLPMPSRAHDGDAGVDLYSARRRRTRPRRARACADRNRGGHSVRDGRLGASPVGIGCARWAFDRQQPRHHRRRVPRRDQGGADQPRPATQPIVVHRGDRIAQLLVQRVELPELIEVSSFDEAGLADTSRGDGGHGSSGGHASL